MKHKSRGRLPSADPLSDEGTPRHYPRHGKRHHGRLFDYGELRLLLLAMISERPRHGYELIKAIEERMEGRYTPSPGVMYPTLAWLDDMGYAAPLAEVSSRKCYRITREGQAFLVANRAAADELLSRKGPAEAPDCDDVPPLVQKALEELKRAMRLRLQQGSIDPMAAAAIAAALHAAVQAIHSSG